MTTVTEIVPHHFQKWRQLQRSYLSVLQKWRQSQRSSPNRSFRARLPSKTNLQSQFLTTVTRGKPEASPRQAEPAVSRSLLSTSEQRTFPCKTQHFASRLSTQIIIQVAKNDDSHRDRTWPLPKATTVTEIVLDHFQKWRQLQRSYLTTSKKRRQLQRSYLDHFPKWRQLQRSYLSVFQKWRQSQRSSPNRSFRARLPSKTNLQSQFLTTVTRGKPEASPRQAEPAVSRSLLSTSEQRTFPCKTQHFASRLSTQIILQVAKMTTVTEIVLDHFQKRRQLQRSYLTTSKSDDSYRDRTWPLPKVTTVTEIVPHHFQKWRQLQRSYLSVLQKWRQSQRSSPNRSFRARLPSKTNLQSQFLTTVTRGKPEASPRQAEPAVSRSLLSTSEQRTFPCKTQHFASRLSTQIIIQVAKMTTVTEIVLDHFQKRRQLQRSYLTTSKSDDSYRDRTWPLPKVTTVTEIVPHHFQKWRQLQRSYLTTSKSDDSYRNRTWPLPKATTVREIVIDPFQKRRQLQRS